MTTLAAVACAEPWYGYYPHQLQWPGVRAPGFEATCWGCRGKRSAEADAEPLYGYYGHPYGLYYGYRPYLAGPGVAGHPGGATSYTQRSPQGLSLGKRSAPEEAEQAYGVHPSGGKSFVANQVWGARGKRSAEPEPYYGYYGHPYLYGRAYHGYGATSYVGRTVWGLGK